MPTPSAPTPKKEEENFIESEKPEQEVEIDIRIINASELELEIVKKEEILTSNPKYELEVQTQDLDLSPRSESSSGASKPLLETPVERQESEKRSGSEERRSSESEPDSEATSVVPDLAGDDDHERKGLFHQGESVEEELPYIPTTLPLERCVMVYFTFLNSRTVIMLLKSVQYFLTLI